MELPVLLAGPMVRRVDPSSVYIMTVTSEKFCRIVGTIYIPNLEGNKYQLIKVKTETQKIKLGDKLYLNLSRIYPIEGKFLTDIILCYNLEFIKGGTSYDLENFGLLEPENPNHICYGNFDYPSFYIKGSKTKGPILYGSCRKLHGKGEDALAAGDRIMANTYDQLNERPQALFMMGDQIYADDVADPIISFISRLGDALTGGIKENLNKLEPRIIEYMDDLQTIGGRGDCVSNLAGFTSKHSSNHLIYFNEYLAMYLLNFSPEIWDIYFKDYVMSERHIQDKQYKKQLKEIQEFSQSVVQVRRLLANTPTYMIFDDHDVTDDWNISYEWKENERNLPLGKIIVANALTAYWAFQGWGNNPTKFSYLFKQAIEKYTRTMDVTGDYYAKWSEMMWNFHHWEFDAPTTPKALFMDIRTKRQYSVENEHLQEEQSDTRNIHEFSEKEIFENLFGDETYQERLPRLINEEGWEDLKQCLNASGWQENEPLILVSPTPLYGVEVIEKPVKGLIYPLEKLGVPVRYMFDMEAWRYNRAGFRNLHKQMINWGVKDLIILSGDVHYAYVYQNHISCQEENELTFTQYTSSPFKNISFNFFIGFVLNLAMIFYHILDSVKQKLRSRKIRNLKVFGHYKKFRLFKTILRRNNCGYLMFDEKKTISYHSHRKKHHYKLLRSKNDK